MGRIPVLPQSGWRRYARRSRRSWGEEGLQALALRYAEAYEGCYGEDEIDRYVGEVCADAYAGLERFGEASKQAADAV